MDMYNHVEYGRDLTLKMKIFEHQADKAFHQSTNSDTLLSISQQLSDIDYAVLVAIDGKDSAFEDNGAEVLIEKPQYFFLLLIPADGDDSLDIMAKQEIAKQNAIQIIAKMMADKAGRKNGLDALLPETFMINSIGPIGLELYGVVLSFNLENNTDYQINNEFWR